MILTDIVRKQRCWPWLHEWNVRKAMSGGNNRRLLYCKRCPVTKARGS